MNIRIRQISEEHRGTMFFGKLVLFPFAAAIDWPEMWTLDETAPDYDSYADMVECDEVDQYQQEQG